MNNLLAIVVMLFFLLVLPVAIAFGIALLMDQDENEVL